MSKVSKESWVQLKGIFVLFIWGLFLKTKWLTRITEKFCNIWGRKFTKNDWNNSESELVFEHDNVPLHTALSVQQFLADKNMAVVPHPPYFPDLAICYFFLFLRIDCSYASTISSMSLKFRNNCKLS
jgi:hypothetical protein